MESDDDQPDETTRQIRNLISRLNPKQTTHSDRVRAMKRFRNFVAGISLKGKQEDTPEFYDDDLPLLLLGDSPDKSNDVGGRLLGLLHACGSLSSDKTGLKRSARNAINLLSYLTFRYEEIRCGKRVVVPLPAADDNKLNNPFANAILLLSPSSIVNALRPDLHLRQKNNDHKRGGDRDDACELIVLLVTSHLSGPLSIATLLPDADARRSFEQWLGTNADDYTRDAVRVADASATGGGVVSNVGKMSPFGSATDGDITNPFKKKSRRTGEDNANPLDDVGDDCDANGANDNNNVGKKGTGIGVNEDDSPMKWTDSILATQELTFTSADANARQGKRDRREREAEKARRNTERMRNVGRDPLGIRPNDFDLRAVESNTRSLLEDSICDLDEEIGEGVGGADRSRKLDSLEQMVSLEAQRDALYDNVFKVGNAKHPSFDGDDEENDGGYTQAKKSILPTESNFDPMLFLTVVHRNASYEQLQSSLKGLSYKTDDQMQQLQNLVRENFDLLVRCAEGIDLFSEQTGRRKNDDNNTSSSGNDGPGLTERMDMLDSLSALCSNQAKSSFKPLLDNTREVRKVQSALSVLNRIGPLLKVPNEMRQHIENGRFSSAVKAYRSVRMIDDGGDGIQLLRSVKKRAAEAANDARRDLERCLASPSVSLQTILDAVRDLDELIELDIPKNETNDSLGGEGKNSDHPAAVLFPGVTSPEIGKFTVDGKLINVREYAPSMACLLLQTAHFALCVRQTIEQTDDAARRIFSREVLSSTESTVSAINSNNEIDVRQDDKTKEKVVHSDATVSTIQSSRSSMSQDTKTGGDKRERSQWKRDMLELRVLATIRAVSVARTWLPRLLRVGMLAHDTEKRRAARRRIRRPPFNEKEGDNDIRTLFTSEVFLINIKPGVARLVDHAIFLSLGRYNTVNGPELPMTFGFDVKERLLNLLRAPLPSTQSCKCATELADLVDIIHNVSKSLNSLKLADISIGSSDSSNFSKLEAQAPLDECVSLGEEGVIIMERRRTIYTFDACARGCLMRASGSGVFDSDALLSCVQKLSEELSRPEECAHEIEKGCELVVRRCCEGLNSYVRDRSDAARLRAVSECAAAMVGRILDVVRAVEYLTNEQSLSLEETLIDDIMALEACMFDEFLDGIRSNISTYARLGPTETVTDDDEEVFVHGKVTDPSFPAYLSASLLAIVRCRAQVEKALGEKTIRKSQGTTYQFLAMSTAADSVVEGICLELSDRMPQMSGKHADKYSNELQFLINTLRRYMSNELLEVVDNCRYLLLAKAGGGFQGDGPDGLGAIEQLERLGRVYVLCLGE